MARILVANDDVELLECCRELLDAAGHVVHAVASGELALEMAFTWRPDLMIVDWQMPDMDGATAIRALRGDPRTASLPIVMMSGSDYGPEAAAEAGADVFLRKPFTAEGLVSSVEHLLASTAAGDGLRS